MALNFPSSPALNDIYIAEGARFRWNGSLWLNDAVAASQFGFTGSRGDTGFTGSQGPIGFTGSQGSIGFTGSQGITGFTGSQGITGFTGSLGFTGSQGEIGFTGSQGAPQAALVSATSPTPTLDGELWWNPDLGTLFINYNDGTSTQWVEATPAVPGPSGTWESFNSTGVLYDYAVDGAVTSVETPTFDANYEYMVMGVDLTSSTFVGGEFDFFRAADSTYYETIRANDFYFDTIALNAATTFILTVFDPVRSETLKTGIMNFSYLEGTLGAPPSYTEQHSYPIMVGLRGTFSSTKLRVRLPGGATFTGGKIYLYKRQVIYG